MSERGLLRCPCGEPSVTTVSASDNGEWPHDRCEDCARHEVEVVGGWSADPPLRPRVLWTDHPGEHEADTP